MTSRLYNVTIDARDPAALAALWCRALGYRVAVSTPDETAIEPPDDPADACPALVFVPVPEGKVVKNRLHVDFAPDDQVADVERLVARGASISARGRCRGWSWPTRRATSSAS